MEIFPLTITEGAPTAVHICPPTHSGRHTGQGLGRDRRSPGRTNRTHAAGRPRTRARHRLRAAVAGDTPLAELSELVAHVSGALKLEQALPDELISTIALRRFRDRDAVDCVTSAPIDTFKANGHLR